MKSKNFLTLEDDTDRLSRNVGKDYHWMLPKPEITNKLHDAKSPPPQKNRNLCRKRPENLRQYKESQNWSRTQKISSSPYMLKPASYQPAPLCRHAIRHINNGDNSRRQARMSCGRNNQNIQQDFGRNATERTEKTCCFANIADCYLCRHTHKLTLAHSLARLNTSERNTETVLVSATAKHSSQQHVKVEYLHKWISCGQSTQHLHSGKNYMLC
jgi:hypothetical protein